MAETKKGSRGPLLGTIWWLLTVVLIAVVAYCVDCTAYHLVLGFRAAVALLGYLVMQVGLWRAELRWDEMGSAAYLEVADTKVNEKVSGGMTPEELDAIDFGDDVVIPEDKKKEAFPVPWGFLVGWWVWGLSYILPIDGSFNISPTVYGIVATAVCFAISFVASVPMSDAVMNRLPKKKKLLSLAFLLGWITLGVMSALDVVTQLERGEGPKEQGLVWTFCLIGPFTVILSQKILFESRKMGTLWETSGKPNFNPIVYNMGGPLFVWGWFSLLMGTSGMPGMISLDDIYGQPKSGAIYLPLFLNWRTLTAFLGGCCMVPVVRFLDYSHDLDGPWCGENDEGAVFKKWWLGTDGTFFGIFLESPWPFVMAWTTFGFSSFITANNTISPDILAIVMIVNCVLQGIDAGILIQQNLYAGNMKGKKKYSLPFVVLFLALAINIGSHWGWKALSLSLPGAILIILGQKTVFGDRRRGDYTMQNGGRANPYEKVLVYSWGEVFFMMGWILICWGAAMP